jgi:hypothetical protein
MDGSDSLMYSSSRLVYEDIRSSLAAPSNSASNHETKELKAVSGALTEERERASSVGASIKKENKDKSIPSFFSRTYVSWTMLTEKMNVYTPVSLASFVLLSSTYSAFLGSCGVPVSPSCLTDSRSCL